jgi:hypothetical protein
MLRNGKWQICITPSSLPQKLFDESSLTGKPNQNPTSFDYRSASSPLPNETHPEMVAELPIEKHDKPIKVFKAVAQPPNPNKTNPSQHPSKHRPPIADCPPACSNGTGRVTRSRALNTQGLPNNPSKWKENEQRFEISDNVDVISLSD